MGPLFTTFSFSNDTSVTMNVNENTLIETKEKAFQMTNLKIEGFVYNYIYGYITNILKATFH